jgi:hypothetical protein
MKQICFLKYESVVRSWQRRLADEKFDLNIRSYRPRVSTVKKMSTEKSENLPESSCPQKAAEAVFVPTSSSHDFTHKVQGKKYIGFKNNLNFIF